MRTYGVMLEFVPCLFSMMIYRKNQLVGPYPIPMGDGKLLA